VDVVLATNASDPALAFRGILRLGGGDAYECLLDVRSNGFVAQRPFWFEPRELSAFVDGLRRLDRELRGETELRTRYEENFVRFTVLTRGAVVVSGAVTQYGPLDQALRFSFETDQTALRPFAEALAAVALRSSASPGAPD
jgi:hypothetical protein